MFKSRSSFNVLYSTDITRTHDFYKQIGAVIEKLESDKVVIKLGDFEIHFVLNTTEPFTEYQYITVPDTYGQGVLFYIETDDIMKAQQLVESAGGIIKAPVFENKWDAKELLFEDPDGYKFALYQS